MRGIIVGLVGCCALVMSGCSGASSDGSGNTPVGSNTGLLVTGSLESGHAAPGTHVVLIWQVSSGSPDYAYKWGDAPVKDDKFALQVQAPPAEALNNGVGVGFIVALPPEVSIPDGILPQGQDLQGQKVDPSAVRFGTEAIIYRGTEESVFKDGWEIGFKSGYSCGQCVKATKPHTFDSFAPAACDNLKLAPSSDVTSCNWT